MPGESADGQWDRPAAYNQELETPYYSTRFDGPLTQTEFTLTAHCGYFCFTFPDGKAVVRLANCTAGNLSDNGNNGVFGVERFNNMAAHFKVSSARQQCISRASGVPRLGGKHGACEKKPLREASVRNDVHLNESDDPMADGLASDFTRSDVKSAGNKWGKESRAAAVN